MCAHPGPRVSNRVYITKDLQAFDFVILLVKPVQEDTGSSNATANMYDEIVRERDQWSLCPGGKPKK